MKHEVIIAGFGGQGVMVAGELLAYAGMLEGKKVSWLPSYGPEMRGGTANCSVVVSDEEIASPVVTEPTVLVVMNRPSLDKFEGWLVPGGLLIINTSLVKREPSRDDINIVRIPCSEVADELGSAAVANMIVVGAVVSRTGIVKMESVVEGLKKVVPAHRHNLIPLNLKALEKGREIALGVAVCS
ncbi:MAG TPA: 2-oxoacid:ferredoxin oxidoreductase subunit gamma [Firmicutes bacterium]|nr:2-oxoacid:ferredoxin oxidoreductase subunit gamma [Bacillota bacterium]